MRIVIISHYAGSPDAGMVFRPYYFAQEWARMGHDVTVVAASYSHLRRIQPQCSRLASVQEYGDRMRYYWLKTPSYKSATSRIINILVFLLRLALSVPYLAKRYNPDIVISSSTYVFDIYLSRWLARRSKAKLIYEVRDLWPLSPMIIGGYSKWHPYIMLMQRAERYAYRKSDRVISLLWNSEEYMRQHGLGKGKFTCIPNGYDPGEWEEAYFQPLPADYAELIRTLRAEGKTIVLFAGGHLRSAGVYTFMQSAELCAGKDTTLAFLFVGDGKGKEELVNAAQKEELVNAHFLSGLPKRQLFPLLQQVDIGFMGGVSSELHRYGIAFNKQIDYMMAGLPIVASVDEPGGLVDRLGNGIRVRAEDPQATADAIRKLAAMPRDELRAMGQRGREYAESHLSIPTLASRMLEAMVS